MCNLFNLVKVTELSHGKSWLLVLSLVILLLVKICLSIFPFDVWDKLLVVIWPVPEVTLLEFYLNFMGTWCINLEK